MKCFRSLFYFGRRRRRHPFIWTHYCFLIKFILFTFDIYNAFYLTTSAIATNHMPYSTAHKHAHCAAHSSLLFLLTRSVLFFACLPFFASFLLSFGWITMNYTNISFFVAWNVIEALQMRALMCVVIFRSAMKSNVYSLSCLFERVYVQACLCMRYDWRKQWKVAHIVYVLRHSSLVRTHSVQSLEIDFL